MTETGSAGDRRPLETAQRLARPALPKRFYAKAAAAPVEGGFGLQLDGRQARTPARRPLVVRQPGLGEAIAAEWNAQGEEIDPFSMPITRIVNSAIDGVTGNEPAVRADIVRFAATDLVCYRAPGPAGLVARQDQHWSPLVDWLRRDHGIRLILAEGVVHVAQDEGALAAFAAELDGFADLGLAALHTATTLTGSAVVALAVARGRISAEAAWVAAHVDEDWEISLWGEDAEASRRRAGRWREMAAAAKVLDLTGPR